MRRVGLAMCIAAIVACAACASARTGGDDDDDDDDDDASDASDGARAASAAIDAAPEADGVTPGDDDAAVTLADAGAADAGVVPPDAAVVPPDAAVVPPTSDNHIQIFVDNFCNMTVSPTEITIPADQTAYFDWHNHSVDYEVDVWMSYGGGYLELATGDTWDEPISHCTGPTPHTEYADISTACSTFHFLIHCG